MEDERRRLVAGDVEWVHYGFKWYFRAKNCAQKDPKMICIVGEMKEKL